MLNLKNELIDIIKIGGSVITDKSEYRSLKKNQLTLISKEIAKWDRKCIIVHGAGSFGHIIAKQYSIQQGYNNQDQLKGILQIRKDMIELTTTVTQSLIDEGMKALSFQTSAMVFEREVDFISNFNPVKKALTLGFSPVLSGDILFTETQGFRIYSGDSLIHLIAQHFDVGRVIFVSDVDGVFHQDSRTKENELIDFITINELETAIISDLEQDSSSDVTGGMKGKITEIKSILNHVPKVILVNGLNPVRLSFIREDEKFRGTTIINENSTKR